MEKEEEICGIISESLSQGCFEKIIISDPFKKGTPYGKIIVDRKVAKGKVFFQISLFFDTKVKHENEENWENTCERIMALLNGGYRQCLIITTERETTVLMSRRGACKITGRAHSRRKKSVAAHDNVKNYIISEGEPIPWLVALGVMNGDGYVLKPMRKKFKQINKFLEMVADVEKYLSHKAHIIDFGCGKAYLTFALYHYFNDIRGREITITGLDLKEDVITDCGKLASSLGYDRLRFFAGDIGSFENGEMRADMVVCLHACDTATDFALYQGVRRGASVILSAPCCQHQLFSQIQNNALQPLLKHGILKERFSTLLTDTLRSLLLEACGYKVAVMEFVDTEHTPKNIMIRAVKGASVVRRQEALFEALSLMREYRVEPKLHGLLYGIGAYNDSEG